MCSEHILDDFLELQDDFNKVNAELVDALVKISKVESLLAKCLTSDVISRQDIEKAYKLIK